MLGLFDGSFSLLGYVDYSRGIAAPGRISVVLRESVDTLYVVAGTRSTSQADRSYSVGVTVTPDAAIPAPNQQIVVLNFIGALGVRIGRQPAVNVPRFDVASIDSRLSGRTTDVVNRVLQMVREDYAGLDVDFYLAGDPNIPAGDLTVIHFGTYSDRYLGLADNVDPFNRDGTQTAIIYTDTFSLFSVFSPSVEQTAQVLANVASHETRPPAGPAAHGRYQGPDGHHCQRPPDALRSVAQGGGPALLGHGHGLSGCTENAVLVRGRDSAGAAG